MQIVFVIASLRGGGAEFVTRVWAGELASRGHDVTVLCTRSPGHEPQIDGVDVRALPPQRLRLGELLLLRRFLAKFPEAAFLSMITNSNLSLVAAALGLARSGPVLISERDILHAESQHSRLHLLGRRLAIRSLYPRADGLVAISHPVAAMFLGLARIPAQRIFVVPNPATAKAVMADGSGNTSAPVNRGDGSERRRIRIIVPARLVEKKRPRLALDIADHVTALGRHVTLEFFGDGPLRSEIGTWARTFPIELHGWREEWYMQLDSSCVVLLPSTVEGFGNVLIEATARDVPVVASSMALGCADAIIPGVTGQLSISDSAPDFAAAIVAASDMTVKPLGEWLERFTSGSSADALWRAIQASLADRGERRTAAIF